MRRGTWFNTFGAEGGILDLRAETREELARLDNELFAVWNLGENALLGWTHAAGDLLFLSVRHYAIPELIHAGADGGMRDEPRFIAKINIHRDKANPIFLGIRNDGLRAFNASKVESLSRGAAAT